MPAVAYTFSASGERAVLQAFRAISAEGRRSQADFARSSSQHEAAQRATARQVRSQGRTTGQEARSRVQAERQANRELLREQQRAAREQARTEKQAAQARLRERKRIDREIFRENARQVREQQRRDRALARRRERRSEAIRSVGLGAIQAIGIGTAGVVGLAARQGVQLQDRATRLAVKGSSATNRVDPIALRREAQDVARSVRGAKAEDVIAAQERFVGKTGRLDLARDFGETFAKISVATQTDMADIGSAAADMMEKFDIKSVSDMEGALAMLAVQGKRGAFELTDAASQFPKMAAAAQRFGLSGVGGLATLGGLSQIARRATPSGEEAATSVENMFKQLVMKSSELERKFGVKVFEDKGKTKTRDVKDIIVETISGTKGNQEKLQKIFDVRGVRAVSPLISVYNQTRQAALGRGATEQDAAAEATAALRKEIDDATNVTSARTEIERDLLTQQQQSSVQLTAAWENVVSSVSDDLTPTLVQELSKLAGAVAETDFSAVTTGFRAVAEAAGMLAEGLYATGILQKKAKTPGELLKEGERDLAKAEAQRTDLAKKAGGIGAFRRADVREKYGKEYAQILTQQEAAQAKIDKAKAQIWQDPAKVQQQLTESQLVEQLAKTGMSETVASQIAGSIASDPSNVGLLTGLESFNPAASVMNYVTGAGPVGPTTSFAPEQIQLMEQFAQTQVQQAAAPQLATGDVNAQLQALSAALGTATAAARGFRPSGGSTAFQE